MTKKDPKNVDLGIRFNGLRQLLIKQYAAPYRQYTHWLDETQRWSAKAMREYQNRRLRELVSYAKLNVPFYRQWVTLPNIEPDMVWTTDDLFHLPVLEKQNIYEQPEAFVSGRYRRTMLYRCHTSGSSGTPLTLYRNLGNIGFEHALIMRQYQWAGVHPRDRVGIFKGALIPESRARKKKFWVYSPVENRLYLSSYHLSPDNMQAYEKALRHYRPVALDGYPSSIYVLARHLEKHGRELPLRAVLTSSETLGDEQRKVMERVFGCRVYDYYGQAERVAAIHTCEHGRYHIIPEYGIVELVPIAPNSHGRFEIIATALNNKAMPLVRYRTGDVIVPGKPDACPCGRQYPQIQSIEGRRDDFIVTRGGRLIGRLDHIFKGAEHVMQAQLYQPDLDHLVLRIVPDHHYMPEDGEYILEQLERRIGESLQINIETVSELDRGGRGKLKSVISNVEAFSETGGGAV